MGGAAVMEEEIETEEKGQRAAAGTRSRRREEEPPAVGKGFTVCQVRIRAARSSFHVSVSAGIGHAITRRIKMEAA